MTSCDELAMMVAGERPDWLQRVLRKLDGYPDSQACWTWLGGLAAGYGRMLFPRDLVNPQRGIGVHRLVWLTRVGPIEPGMVLDHDGPNGCHNRACANPNHLSMVTVRHNLVMTGGGICADEARRTECPKGHPLVDGNLRRALLKRGQRSCLTCSREANAARSHLISRAMVALGMTHRDYTARFGYSAATARALLDAAARGGDHG